MRSLLLSALQWSGMVGVTTAYWFYLTKPRLAATLTLAGCIGLAIWALATTPPAWGVAALEAVVIAITLRNLLKT